MFGRKAFANTGSIDMFSCNALTPLSWHGLNFEDKNKSASEVFSFMLAQLSGQNSFVKNISIQIPQVTVSGYFGQTNYGPAGNGQLPVGTKNPTNAFNSPQFNGTYQPTVRFSSQNGNMKQIPDTDK